jgi:hypothetical protein
MKAVTSAGRKRYAAGLSLLSALASGLAPATAQTQQDGANAAASPVEMMEQLMREQQAVHSRHALQIQNLRQQIDQQTVQNQAQDWLLASSLAGAMLMVLAGAWLLSRWPQWQQARHQRQARRSERQAMQAAAALRTDLRSSIKSSEREDFAVSGLHAGGEIDHSGPGMLARVLGQRKLRQKLSEPTPDALWLTQIDELDSHFLADDALREYELRKTVGLIPTSEEQAESVQAKSQASEQGLEAVWESMHEVPLAPVEAENAAKPDAAVVDVSLEVQRVRKALEARRQRRASLIAESANAVAKEEDEPVVSEPVLALATEPVAKEESSTQFAQIELAPEPEARPVAVDVDEMRVSYVQEPSDTFSPSIRAMSDAETRLALAREFEKLGQFEEAAQLCEEVLASGDATEKFKARQVLSALPGR